MAGSTNPSDRAESWTERLAARFDDIHLDALGLLDADDRLDLEAWLASIPPAARARVWDEQRRLAETAPTADAAVPLDLRERVIASVIRAARAETTAAASASDQHDNGRPAPEPRRRRHSARPNPAQAAATPGGLRRPGRRVHHLWRTLAVALALGMVALMTIHLDLRKLYTNVSDGVEMAAMLEAVGSDQIHDVLFDGQVQRLFLRAVELDDPNCKAMLLYHPERSSARLFVYRFPAIEDGRYAIVELDHEDRQIGRPLATFDAGGVLQQVDIPIRPQSDLRIALVSLQGGHRTVLMETVVQRSVI